MSRSSFAKAAAVFLLLYGLCGCMSPSSPVAAGGSQVELRAFQTREYDTVDKRSTLRSVIATLQDLGFVIDTANYELAAITGTKLDVYTIRMTVTVREIRGQRLAVRANALYNEKAIEEPQTYQDFFMVLDKSMFLTLHRVD
jgi:hypothetical protein